jgi:16S rRNA (adenine1518-N6/adenine1519-N6)-dimethyltransferase
MSKEKKHKPKKSLGQNFLTNPKVAERIAREAKIKNTDVVLEIGPGKGDLTKFLLASTKKVIAVEKDTNLYEFLNEKFAKEISEKKLLLLNEDILDFDMSRTDFDYKIVANIPYNITGAILKKFLEANKKPTEMILMVQKEVAERIISGRGKENLLSISVKIYGTPKILFQVSRGNFFPAPNVDSAVIQIKNISNQVFKKHKISEKIFFQVVKAGFAHKRKKLSSNLKKVLKNKDNYLNNILGNKRAEDLSLQDWILYTKSL